MSSLQAVARAGLVASLALLVQCGEEPEGPESVLAHRSAPTDVRVESRHRNLPLNNPSYVAGSRAGFMRPGDWVVGVAHKGVKRAYPWSVLANHHVVNDTLANDFILVASCEVCGASTAYLARTRHSPDPSRGRRVVLSFSVGGRARGTWVGQDAETGSKWYPFVGLAFDGPLEGERLARLRTFTTTWEDWYRAHPDTQVVFLSEEMRRRGHGLGHRPGDRSVYPGMTASEVRRILAEKPKLRWRDPAELVFGVFDPAAVPPAASAWPLRELKTGDARILQVDLGRQPVLLVAPGGSPDALGVAAYRRAPSQRTLEFSVRHATPLTLADQDGDLWNAWGECTEGRKKGMYLEPADGYLTKWYEWVENFPHTELRGERIDLSLEDAVARVEPKPQYDPPGERRR
jgi:hypothetical protein